MAAGATLTTLPGDLDLSSNGVNIEGTLVLSGNRLVLYDNGICNTGLLQVAATSTIAGVANVDNRTRIEFSGSDVTLELDYEGVSGPILLLRGGSSVDLGSGGLLWLRRADPHFEAGAQVVGNGRIRLSGHLAVDAGGVDVVRTVTFELTEEGILHGEADFGAACVVITGGEIVDRLTIPQDGTVRVTGADGQYLHALRICGTGTLAAGPLIRAADLTNEGTLTVDGAVRIGQSSCLTNHGTLTFNANGSLELDNCDLTSDGTIKLGDGGLLWLHNTDSRLTPATQISGRGVIRLGATDGFPHLTLDGSISLPATVTLELNPGGLLHGEADFGAACVVITGGEIVDRLTIPQDGTVRVTGADGQYLHALRICGTGTLAAGPLIRAADLTNEGTLTVDGAVRIGQSSCLTNHGTLTFNANGSLELDNCDLTSDGVLDLGARQLRVNSGAVRLSGLIKTAITVAGKGSKGSANPIMFGRITASSSVDVTSRLDVTAPATELSALLEFPVVQGGWLSGSVQVMPSRWRADCSHTTVMLRPADSLRTPVHSRLDPGWTHAASLQQRLTMLMTGVVVPKPGPVALVDLTDSAASPSYAHWLGDKAVAVGSIAKVAAMLAAYQLRADLRMYATTSAADDFQKLFSDAAVAWNVTGARGPRLAEIFTADRHGGSWTIDFLTTSAAPEALDAIHSALEAAEEAHKPADLTQLRALAFGDWMSLMIGWSDNYAAAACIRQLGFDYIARVAQELGLYDCGNGGGLWLASEYKNIGAQFGPHIAAVADPVSGSSQAATALALAAFLAMLNHDQLIKEPDPDQAPEACAEMRGLMTRWANGGYLLGSRSFFVEGLTDPNHGQQPAEVQSKIGMTKKKNAPWVVGEAGIIYFTLDPARHYATVSLITTEDSLHKLAAAVDNALIAQHR